MKQDDILGIGLGISTVTFSVIVIHHTSLKLSKNVN